MEDWQLTQDKIKRYPHFDAPLSIDDAMALVKDPARVARHAFFPLLLFREEWWPFRKEPKKKRRKKTRNIRYAARSDSYIYSFYRDILYRAYEKRLSEMNISDCVIAYRKIKDEKHGRGKSNIDFAADAFKFISKLDKSCAITLDISKFFENIDHDRLKKVWCDLLEIETLPPDHYAVYKNITKYSEADRDLVYERLGLAIRRPGGGWEYTCHKNEVPIQICTPSNFRRKIASDRTIVKKNSNNFGIPQGAPLSDLLANAYLMKFDSEMSRYVRRRRGLYLRYSDDILIVIPGDSRAGRSARDFAIKRIRKAGRKLKIKTQKTTIVEFSKRGEHLSFRTVGRKNCNGLEYLGFRFDGRRIFFRNSTISNLNRKISKSIHVEASALVRRYRGKDKNYLTSKLYADGFLQNYGRVAYFDPSEGPKGWTFWTYARRSAAIMGSMALVFDQLAEQRKFVLRSFDGAIAGALRRGVPVRRRRIPPQKASEVNPHTISVVHGYKIEDL